MKNRVLIILSVIVLLVSISLLFIGWDYIMPKNFEDFLGKNEINITKVFMRNGSNGSAVSTDNTVKIKKLINSINNRNYRKSFDQGLRTGYNYFYTFYVDDKDVLTITGTGNYVNISGVYYDVDKAISGDEITEWFKELPRVE